MSSRKELFLRIAGLMSIGDVGHIAEWFAEDLKLHNPSIGGFRYGHSGARDMLCSLTVHVPCARIDVHDTVEEGDNVMVRWLFAGEQNVMPAYLPAVAIYRFDDDRIAEDWGIDANAERSTTVSSAAVRSHASREHKRWRQR